MANKVIAYLALGSNINDRMKYLEQAREALQTHSQIEILKASKVYETEPWKKGEDGQEWFLNQVLEVEVTLLPHELLTELKKIEEVLGRKKREHWGAREIDIDILLYNSEFIDTAELQIPHRHMQDRQFVLLPLLEIAPDLKHPVIGKTF